MEGDDPAADDRLIIYRKGRRTVAVRNYNIKYTWKESITILMPRPRLKK